MEKYPKVAIGIPTNNSHKYIYKNLTNLVTELKKDDLKKYELVICLNGENEKNSFNEIKRFFEENNEIKYTIIRTMIVGKNNALNLILNEVAERIEIIHFLDDDIEFNIDSILININTLINYKKDYKVPVLVGSNLYVKPKNIYRFINENNNIIIAIKKYVFYNVFSAPFLEKSQSPSFCMGGSLCFYCKDFEGYPSDDTGIADDGYIGNYFAIKGKALYYNENKLNIIKPCDSKMYFGIPTKYKEWLNQQIRIYVGVYYSYLYYEKQIEYFKEIFSWKYSVSKEFRGEKNNNIFIKESIYYYIYRLLQKIVLKKSMNIIREAKCPEWALATTSKTY